jgi:hypothetical protein
MNTAMTDDIVKSAATQLGPLGDPVTFTFVESKVEAPYTSYIYRATFKSGTVTWIYTLDQQGKIAGLHALPTQ